MNDLERFAAGLLHQWRTEGSSGTEPIGVTAAIDRLLPYRVARRDLGVDSNEDYEALMLRLLAEEQDLVHVEPVDVAEMARTTMASKLPDLGVLQLLRAGTLTFPDTTIARLDGAAPAKAPKWERPAEPSASPVQASSGNCWSCYAGLPVGRAVKFCPFCGADQRAPACRDCGAAMEPTWKHCADCGLEQQRA